MLQLFFIVVAFFSVSAACAQSGCTDPQAENYNPQAQVNDGSCKYKDLNLKPNELFLLPGDIDESSGLVMPDTLLWTHNDSQDRYLYAIDPGSGTVVHKVFVANAENEDWEDIAVDANYVYVGDIGNNFGNRKNLRFFRIRRAELVQDTVQADTISFAYEDQVDFSPKPDNQTDFDAEAFVIRGDSIYLFTKQWIAAQTKLYAIPKKPGQYQARLVDRYNVNGLITGAVGIDSLQLVVLCGYTKLMQPFLYLLYDFPGHRVFSGNVRRLNLNLPFYQIEGIATADGMHYYLSNENLQAPLINSAAKIHYIDLYPYLRPFLQSP